eukprot:3940402-Rhodomonas_salina.2
MELLALWISLCPSCAISGTDLATSAISLCSCYAMSCTDLACGAREWLRWKQPPSPSPVSSYAYAGY